MMLRSALMMFSICFTSFSQSDNPVLDTLHRVRKHQLESSQLEIQREQLKMLRMENELRRREIENSTPDNSEISNHKPSNIRELLGEQLFKQMGLPKLSKKELETLNDWLGYVFSEVRDRIDEVKDSIVIESSVSGTFNGWDGATVFKLENGQVWEQAGNETIKHQISNPKVLIYFKENLWKASIDEINDAVAVKRLK